MKRWPPATGLVLTLCAGGLFATSLALRARQLWPFTVDDTFISLHYAKHLAQGHGLRWNVQGAPVEGYTTLLWVLLLALGEWLGANGPLLAKLGSTLFAFVAIALASWLAVLLCVGRDPRARWLGAALPFAVATAYWKLAVHAVSGMETTLAASLLTALFCLAVRFGRHARSADARGLSVLALLATLARPEVALAAGVSVLALFATGRANRPVLVRALLCWTIAPGLVYFVVRYAAFGLLFPLPFYVKATGHGTLSGLADVSEFFWGFLGSRPDLLASGLVTLLYARRAALPVWLGCAALALFFLFPSHIMGFEGRYLIPLLPALLALSGAGLTILVDMALTTFCSLRAQRWLPVLGWALCALTAAVPFPAGRAESDARWLDYGHGLARAHVQLARALRAASPGVHRPVIALLDVGAVAYYSDWFVVDTFGLNDRRVALSRRTDLGHVFSYEPELVVFVSGRPDTFEPVFAWEIALHAAAVERGYVATASYPFLADYHLRVLARAGSTLAPMMASCPGPN